MENNQRLTRDLVKASATLTDTEARYLVDLYYQMQDNRIAADGQCRSIDQAPAKELKDMVKEEATRIHIETGISMKEAKAQVEASAKMEEFAAQIAPAEPHETLTFFGNAYRNMEDDIKKALQKYVESKKIGRWMMSICGIGPVIAAGLIANIDIRKAPTAGHIWNYAGLNPDQKWEKGQKRPWNARLRCLCYKIGESFVKVQNNDNDVYGKFFKERKALETQRNEAGMFAEQAAYKLKNNKIGKNTDAYKAYVQGILPPAHIHARARRYAVKMFLSHLHAVWYEMEFGEKPPKPFAIAILGHGHEVPIPNWK